MTTLDLADRVYFEVIEVDSAGRLTCRLGRERAALLDGDEPCIVVASFESEPAGLAELLREVESWIAEESLCAIRFLLDDRIYVLEAGEVDWSAHPWWTAAVADESPQTV